MSTIPQTAKQRGSYDFETHYCNLCALQDTVPLVEVKAHLRQGALDINGDRIRLADWPPILRTLCINKSLRFIAIRSFYSQAVDKDGNAKEFHCFKRRKPAIRSKDMTLRLAQSLSECLKKTENLKCLDLQGVPFRERDLNVLAKGLSKNKTVTHVSMEYCQMGDDGCGIISKALKQHPSLTHINFSGCNLTWKSGEVISELIKHQSTERHNEAWADSLRYRQPNLDSMTGLRRITLNCNPMIGDSGVLALADSLKDDLWLKALDLQKCGIGRDGANVLIETLQQNKVLVVLDVRFNPLIDRSLLHALLGQVLINSNGYDDKEFPWIVSETPKDPYHTKPRRRYKQIGSGYGKKTSIKMSSKSALKPVRSYNVSPGHRGGGWRTAYRASQYKAVYDNKDQIGTPRYLQNAEVGHATIMVEEEDVSEDDLEEPSESVNQSKIRSRREDSDSPRKSTVIIQSYDEEIRKLRIDLLDAQRTAAEERKGRHLAEKHAINLEVENAKLKRELHEEREVSGIQTALGDEMLLESIENSFNKFHDFLNLLEQLGLGGLVAYAGMSETDFPLRGNNHMSSEEGHSRARSSSKGRRQPSKSAKAKEIESHSFKDEDLDYYIDGVSAVPPSIVLTTPKPAQAVQQNQKSGEKDGVKKREGRVRSRDCVDKGSSRKKTETDKRNVEVGGGDQ